MFTVNIVKKSQLLLTHIVSVIASFLMFVKFFKCFDRLDCILADDRGFEILCVACVYIRPLMFSWFLLNYESSYDCMSIESKIRGSNDRDQFVHNIIFFEILGY